MWHLCKPTRNCSVMRTRSFVQSFFLRTQGPSTRTSFAELGPVITANMEKSVAAGAGNTAELGAAPFFCLLNPTPLFPPSCFSPRRKTLVNVDWRTAQMALGCSGVHLRLSHLSSSVVGSTGKTPNVDSARPANPLCSCC